MNKITLAVVAGALALLATPASAQHYGYGHSHGYAKHAHVQHFSYHKPVHYGHQVYKPSYHAPVYVAPTTTYVKRPAYVYQKVSGYCLEAVTGHGYNQHRKTVECKAGEYQKPAPKVAHVEPAPAPTEEVPQK